jgi:hypothetical protein
LRHAAISDPRAISLCGFDKLPAHQPKSLISI